MTSFFSAEGGLIWIKFRRLVQNDMSTAVTSDPVPTLVNGRTGARQWQWRRFWWSPVRYVVCRTNYVASRHRVIGSVIMAGSGRIGSRVKLTRYCDPVAGRTTDWFILYIAVSFAGSLYISSSVHLPKLAAVFKRPPDYKRSESHDRSSKPLQHETIRPE